MDLAQREGVILAFPLSRKLEENEGEWILNTAANSRQDIDFITGVIEDIAANHPVDRSRIYATATLWVPCSSTSLFVR